MNSEQQTHYELLLHAHHDHAHPHLRAHAHHDHAHPHLRAHAHPHDHAHLRAHLPDLFQFQHRLNYNFHC